MFNHYDHIILNDTPSKERERERKIKNQKSVPKEGYRKNVRDQRGWRIPEECERSS